MDFKESARQCFSGPGNCSQSVFSVFAKNLGLELDTALKVASAFGGGMGRRQHTCGAVTGALMAIGLRYGMGTEGEVARKEKTYQLAGQFMDEFTRRHGSLSCRDLLEGLSMTDPDDLRLIEEKGLFRTSCVSYVTDAVEILESVFAENP